MDFRHLETIRTIARLGSLAKAAAALNYAQPTITLHVQELEAEFGVRLFERRRAAAVPTEAGTIFAQYAERVLREGAELRDAMHGLSGGQRGDVRLGAIDPAASVLLPTILAEFSRSHPRVNVALEVGGTAVLSRRVAARELDLALCSPPSALLNIEFAPVWRETLVLLVPARLAREVGRVARVRDLSHWRLLVTEETCAYRQVIDTALDELGIRPESIMEIGSVRALGQSVQAGLGVALIPATSYGSPPRGTVVRPVDKKIVLPVGIARRAGRDALSPAAEQLARLLRDRLQRTG